VTSQTFEEFFQENYTVVLKFAARRIDSERAHDVAADCFAIAWKKYDPVNPFLLSWLFQTARHLIGNAYRSRQRDENLIYRLAQQDCTSRSDQAIDLSEALALLSTEEFRVLHLTYWEKLSASEIGAIAGCTEAAVWKRISRAREHLRLVLIRQNQWEQFGPVFEVAGVV